jgi:hypothetical protein
MADLRRTSDEEPGGAGAGAGRELDLEDRVRLLRPVSGFPAGSTGTVVDVWCAGRCLVELGPFDAAVVVEVEVADVEPSD